MNRLDQLNADEWEGLKAERAAPWNGFAGRADQCQRGLDQHLAAFFDERSISVAPARQAYEQEREGLRQRDPAAFERLTVRRFLESRLDLVPASGGWAEPDSLRPKLVQAWHNAFNLLRRKVEANPAAKHTQAVLAERERAPRAAPTSLHNASLLGSAEVSQLFGEDYDQFLDAHGLTQEAAADAERSGAAGSPTLRRQMPQLFTAHLTVTRRLEERRRFWTNEAAARQEFQHWREPGLSWLERLWIAVREFLEELLGRRRDRTSAAASWVGPNLERIPSRREFWDKIYLRREECVRDAAELDQARVALNERVAVIARELEQKNNELHALEPVAWPPDPTAALAGAAEQSDQAQRSCEDVADWLREADWVLSN